MACDLESESREYPSRPVPGVGAVVLRECDGHSEVLLVRRARAPLVGTWSLPGGAIELGETAAEACVREVREETGLEVAVVEAIEAFDIILRDAGGAVQYHYLIVDMLCEARGGVLCAGEDASETVWAKTEGVLEHGEFALTERACTVIRRAMQRSVGKG